MSLTVRVTPLGSHGLAHVPAGASAYQVAIPVAELVGAVVVLVVGAGEGGLVGGLGASATAATAVVEVVVAGATVVATGAGSSKANLRFGIASASGRVEAGAAARPPPATPGAALGSDAPVPRSRRGTPKSPRLSNEPTRRRLPPVLCALRPPPFSGDITPAPARGPAEG